MTSFNKKIIFIMGVSGCGKSSVGQLLADELSTVFIDADDHHLPANIEKMSQGTPLTDEDRAPWLDKINQIATEHLTTGAVIACSGLKETYRKRLVKSIEKHAVWVYLKGDYDLIYRRMKDRKGHFMGAAMLKSQFDTLQEPSDAVVVDIANSLERVIRDIALGLAYTE